MSLFCAVDDTGDKFEFELFSCVAVIAGSISQPHSFETHLTMYFCSHYILTTEQPFALIANGQKVMVTCPPNVKPGQKIRFQLPIQLTQQQLETYKVNLIFSFIFRLFWRRIAAFTTFVLQI